MNTAIELIVRILCDTRPERPVDGAYLYCTTIDNQASIFRTARMLISHAIASRIYILDAPAMSGYPGVKQCSRRLRELGLPADKIDYVPYGGTESINTLVESQALVRAARDRGIGSLVLVSPPFHQLRAFMTAATVALKFYPDVALYSHPGAAMSWMASVVHSQGTLQAQRRQLIQEELVRVHTYQNKGDLACFEDVLDYLNRRDVPESSQGFI
jgi:uncharacterized SAM-binding protein YcdF (DUF218 family)